MPPLRSKKSRCPTRVQKRYSALCLGRDFGIDCVINAGGGVHGHPDGAVGGGRAFRQAIEVVLAGGELSDVDDARPELAKALSLWGGAGRS